MGKDKYHDYLCKSMKVSVIGIFLIVILSVNVSAMSSSVMDDFNVNGNIFSSGNLSVYDLTVRSGSSITLANLTIENSGTHTDFNTDAIFHVDEEPTAFLGIHAHNDSVLTYANFIMEAGSEAVNSVFNLIKNSPLHPFSPNSSGIINDGSHETFVPHANRISWWGFTSLNKDENGNIENLTGLNNWGFLNKTGLFINGSILADSFIGDGSQLTGIVHTTNTNYWSSSGTDVFLATGGTFVAAVNYTAGSSPFSVDIGDVNNDGYEDLAVANSGSGDVSVFINDGDGTFAGAVSYTTGLMPRDVIIGDLDNDGYADLAVASYGPDSVSILINNGDGTFATRVDYNTGLDPWGISMGDLDNDGYEDLAVANTGSSNVSVFINNGDGTFASRVDYTAGSNTWGVSIGDVNNDGYADLATANFGPDNISVLINDGDGTFATKVDYVAGPNPRDVAIRDLNNDGYADIASANSNSGNVSVFINDGDGTFADKVDYATGLSNLLYSVTMGDVNNDGYVDIVAANVGSSGNISVFINNGDGTFASRVTYDTGGEPYSISIGDVNNDGYEDIAAANSDGFVSVFINDYSTTFIVDKLTGNVNITGNYVHQGNIGFTGDCVNVTYSGGIAISCND